MSAPLSHAKLSSLSTSTLSSILELTRAHQLGLNPSPTLTSRISNNLSTLRTNLLALHDDSEVTEGLRKQYGRLVDLVQGFDGVRAEALPAAPLIDVPE